MDAYEVKNQELIAENADLRALLRSMQVGSWFVIVLICWNFCLQTYMNATCVFPLLVFHWFSLDVILDLPATFALLTFSQYVLLFLMLSFFERYVCVLVCAREHAHACEWVHHSHSITLFHSEKFYALGIILDLKALERNLKWHQLYKNGSFIVLPSEWNISENGSWKVDKPS